MPPPRRPLSAAADALIVVVPLAHRWIERLLASHHPPLTITQFLALQAIAAERVSGSELARRAGVSGPAVSQLLSGLADAGLLDRGELPEDRRRQTLVLSGLGQRALTSAQALVRDGLTPLLGDLPRPEAEALSRALPHLAAALSGTPPPRRRPPRKPPGGPRPAPPRRP